MLPSQTNPDEESLCDLFVAFPCILIIDSVPDRKYEFSYDDLGNLVLWSIWTTMAGSPGTVIMDSSGYDVEAAWKDTA